MAAAITGSFQNRLSSRGCGLRVQDILLPGCAPMQLLYCKLNQPSMDQPCYKCGQVVDEGRVFCPHCRAPQIRVIVAEPAAAVPAASAALAPLTSSETVPLIAVPTRWDQAAQPCAVAALIAALGIVLGLINPVIAPIGAGFLAVALYRRRNPEIRIQARTGVRLGAICGFFCFGMTTILGSLRVLVLHEGGKIRNTFLDAIQQQSARNPDPQLQTSLDFLRSPAGLLLMFVLVLVAGLVIFVLLGVLGGALGGAGLGRRDRG